MPVLTRSMVGYFSRSKKSADLRWPSRVSSPVLMDATSALASTFDFKGSSAMVSVPLNLLKRPRTLLAIRWRATKPTDEWTGSMFHVPGVRSLIEYMLCALCLETVLRLRQTRISCDHKDLRGRCLRTQPFCAADRMAPWQPHG